MIQPVGAAAENEQRDCSPGEVALAFLGLSRWRRLGAALSALTVAVWTWVLFATWTVKLLPEYSTGGAAPRHLRDIWTWYGSVTAARMHDLSLLSLAPVPLLFAGSVICEALAVALGGIVIYDLCRVRTSAPRAENR